MEALNARINVHFHHYIWCLCMKWLGDNDCTGILVMETKAAAERSVKIVFRESIHSFIRLLTHLLNKHLLWCCGCVPSFHGTSIAQRSLGRTDCGSQILALEGIFLQMETVVIR